MMSTKQRRNSTKAVHGKEMDDSLFQLYPDWQRNPQLAFTLTFAKRRVALEQAKLTTQIRR